MTQKTKTTSVMLTSTAKWGAEAYNDIVGQYNSLNAASYYSGTGRVISATKSLGNIYSRGTAWVGDVTIVITVEE